MLHYGLLYFLHETYYESECPALQGLHDWYVWLHNYILFLAELARKRFGEPIDRWADCYSTYFRNLVDLVGHAPGVRYCKDGFSVV